MITAKEILMGRDTEFPLSDELKLNLDALVLALNQFRSHYAVPMIVSSGYRPGYYNRKAGGAPGSAHETCLATDFKDESGILDAYCLANLDILEECNLYLEDPKNTPGWCHLTIRPPKSGHRVFLP